MDKSIKNSFKFSYLSLYLIFIMMIFFSKINLFFGNFPVTLYRIFLIPMLFIVFFDMIYKKSFYLPYYSLPFIITFGIFMFIGFEARNITSLIAHYSVFLIFFIVYNILFNINFDKSVKLKISFTITILLFISTITMFTDYIGLTKFLKYVNPDSYHDFLRVGRPASILGAETNFTASRFGALMPFLFYYILNEKKNIKKLVFVLITLMFTIIGQILTGSRMGYLTLLIILIIFTVKILVKLNIKAKLITILIAITLSLIAIPIIKHQEKSSKLASRMQNVQNFVDQKGDFSKGENSIAVRFILFIAGIDMIKHHPIFGVGIGNSKYESLKYINEGYGHRYLHNSFLSLGAENGIIVLSLFLLLYFSITYKSFKLSIYKKDDFWFFLGISLIVQFINFFFLSDLPNRIFWTILLPIGNLIFLEEKKL